MKNWNDPIRRRLRGLRLSPTREREIVDELAQHLQDRYEELRAGGATDEIAFRDAIAELEVPGFLARRLTETEQPMNPELAIAGAHGASFAATLWQDLRYAARVLRKSPTFTLVSTLTLALGIGATTAIFSVVNGVMLRPLPLGNSERLVRIYESDLLHGRPAFSVSQPNFLDFRSRNRTFERVVATGGTTVLMTTADGVAPLVGRRVTIDFLPALGMTPAIGRNFLPEEDRPGGNTRVAIVTHGFWQHRLGGDTRIGDHVLTLNGASYTVVGVLPPSFRWTVPDLDLIVPLAPDPRENRGDHQMTVFGLLKPGIGLQQADADLRAIAAQLSAEYPESNGGWSVLLSSFYDWLVPVSTRQMLLVLLGAVVFVLLIAAGNVANLLLARAAARQKEMSIRIALGASRWRIVSQLLVESLILSLVGGAAGCGVAAVATTTLQTMAPRVVPRLDEVAIDTRVLAFALALSVVTGIVFGLAPALHASRRDAHESLKDAGRAGSGGVGRQRLRDALVVAEVALSVSLLIAAGLLVRSMWTLQRVNPGFDPSNLLTMQTSVIGPGEGVQTFYRNALERIGALPGIASVATTSSVPMSGANTTSIQVVVEGLPVDAAGIVPSADWRVVSPGYFRTLGLSLRGRDFDDRDAGGVAIISEEMARRYWPGEDPIGRQFHWFSTSGARLTVVGVAGDVRNLSLETAPAPVIYRPANALRIVSMALVIRTSTDPESQTAAVREVIRSVNPTVPVTNVRTATAILEASIGSRRFTMVLLESFAALALILACVGLFGVMSYLVSQRTHDIGVRLALGAAPADIFRLVVGRGMALATGGALLGLAAAFWLSRSLEALLFQVRPTDLLTFATVVIVLLAVALIACAIPARRATRVDPVIALRYE
jgi:putative ABC transport system permease protein